MTKIQKKKKGRQEEEKDVTQARREGGRKGGREGGKERRRGAEGENMMEGKKS